MKFSLNRGSVILLSLLLLCASCGDADLFDTDKWSDKIEGWEPGVKGAIAHGEFTLWDLLKDSITDSDSPIHKEPIEAGSKDSILVIKYTEENIYKVDISEVFELKASDINFEASINIPTELEDLLVDPNSSIDVGSIPDELREINETVFDTLRLPEEFNGTIIKNITLGKGLCFISSLPDLDEVMYSVTILYYSNGIKEELITCTNDENGPINISLEGKTFDLDEDNQIQLFVSIKLLSGTYKGETNKLDFWINFKNYDFSRIEGKVVKNGGIEIEEDSFDMDIDFLNDIGGNFKFADPKLELVIRNKGIGLPVSVDMIFEGQDKDGNKGTLDLNEPLKFEGNASIDRVESISEEINKDNSTIVDFLSLPPQGNIYYSGKVNLNPGGDDNVIYKDGSMDMDVNISIPLSLTDSLSYRETLEDIDIDQKYADKIKEGTISIKVLENGLPMDLSVPKLILMTENETPIDTISVLSSTGDAQIKANKSGTLVFKINQKQAKNLGQTEKILLEAVLFSETATPVRSDAKLKFALILEAKAVITDLDDF